MKRKKKIKPIEVEKPVVWETNRNRWQRFLFDNVEMKIKKLRKI